MSGGENEDIVSGGENEDVVSGGENEDVVSGGENEDVVSGGENATENGHVGVEAKQYCASWLQTVRPSYRALGELTMSSMTLPNTE